MEKIGLSNCNNLHDIISVFIITKIKEILKTSFVKIGKNHTFTMPINFRNKG